MLVAAPAEAKIVGVAGIEVKGEVKVDAAPITTTGVEEDVDGGVTLETEVSFPIDTVLATNSLFSIRYFEE